jgi:hypothetical protein
MSPGQLFNPPRLTGFGALLENGTENSKKCKQLLEEYISIDLETIGVNPM